MHLKSILRVAIYCFLQFKMVGFEAESSPIGCARRCLRSTALCTSFTYSESSDQCVISGTSPGEICPIPTTDATCPREQTIKVLMKESGCHVFCFPQCRCRLSSCCHCFLLMLQAIAMEETPAAPQPPHVRPDKETVTVTLTAAQVFPNFENHREKISNQVFFVGPLTVLDPPLTQQMTAVNLTAAAMLLLRVKSKYW